MGLDLTQVKNDADQTWNEVDGVSGATLTSYAIIASIAKRTTGNIPFTKFDPQPNLEKLKQALPAANSIRFDESTNMWTIQNSDREMIGSVLLTTPYADNQSGYQGPTATAIVFGEDSKVVSVYVDQTFENQPYADYLNDDYHFQDLFQGLNRTELADLDIEALGVEGVSGATMTSMNVARSIPVAATRSQILQTETSSRMPTRSWISYWPDATTIAFVICGAMFSITSFKYRRFVRIIFQLALIVFLGFINGHVLSQALIAGWATSTIPWSVAPGLVFFDRGCVCDPDVLTAPALLPPGLSNGCLATARKKPTSDQKSRRPKQTIHAEQENAKSTRSHSVLPFAVCRCGCCRQVEIQSGFDRSV